MANRLDLQAELKKLCPNVYFQPPESQKMIYPCFRYVLNDIDVKRANDDLYLAKRKYTITYIDKNPDNEMIEKMIETFQYCSFDRFYSSDNLNHYVYSLFY